MAYGVENGKTGKCNKNLLDFFKKIKSIFIWPKKSKYCNYDFIVIIIFGDNKIIIPYLTLDFV